jgi:hypothetical protein
MRCYCCNRILNDFEATRKSSQTGEYLDTCNTCLDGLGIETDERPDLNPFDEVPDDDYNDVINHDEYSDE